MMRRTHLNEVVTNNKQRRRRIVRQRILSVVACLIVFCMTYATILPALANRDASAVTTSTTETTTAQTPENVVSAIQTEPNDDWATVFADANLTGVWREDLISIAESQLGYIESARNFVIAEDGETTKGYTYFGDWYGDPYGDWDAMFVSFCLNFAGIEDMPLDADPQAMVDVLDVTGEEVEEAIESGKKVPTDYYYTVQEYSPIAGDLVFFDTTGDGLADRVGIVTDVSLDGTQVKTIEGDSNNKVQNNTYEAADSTILGYGTLPAQPVTYTYTANGLTVKVSLPQGTTVPADAVLSVKPIEVGNEGYDALAEQASDAVDGEIATIKLLDISFYTAGDNTYIPVDDDAKVTITFGEPVAASKDSDVVVLHYDDSDKNPVVLDYTEIAEQATEAAEVKFETAGFSTFAVVEVATQGYATTVTSILGVDQINNLDGLTLMISTAVQDNNTDYAVTSNTVKVKDGNGNYDRLTAAVVTRANGTVTANSTANSLDGMLWEFKKVTNNTYNIKAKGTEQYLNLGEGNSNLTLSETAQNIYITATDDDGNQVYLQRIDANGRYLAFSNGTNPLTFAAYGADNNNNNNRARLVLSIPVIETTALNAAVCVDGDAPLDGKILAISTRDSDVAKSTGYHGLSSIANGNNLQAYSVTHSADNNTVYISENVSDVMFWKFTSTGTADQYYIQPYSITTGTTDGRYLWLSGGANEAKLLANGQNENGCKFTVKQNDTQPNGGAVGDLSLKSARYLGYDTNNYFTAYNNTSNDDDGQRSDIILSEYVVPIEDLVTDLDGKTLAIVSVRDNATEQTRALTATAEGGKLKGVDANFTDDSKLLVDIDENNVWYFKAVAGKTGVYTIKVKDQNGAYLNFGHDSAGTSATPQEVTVYARTLTDGSQVVTLKIGTEYLNQSGGGGKDVFAGWNTNGDPGNNFVLASRATFTAEILSRAEIYDRVRTAGTKIVFFVRNTDANGNVHYYALNANGDATEVYLKDDLTAGGTIYGTGTNAELNEFLWDATGSLTGGWHGDNKGPDGHIDIQPISLSEKLGEKAGWMLLPNCIGGVLGNEKQDPILLAKPNQHENVEPMRGEHVPSLENIASLAAGANIDTSIASVYNAFPETEVDTTGNVWHAVQFNGTNFVAVEGENNNNVDDSFAIYVAAISNREEIPEEDSSSDTLLIQTLTRHELYDASVMEDAKLVLFTKYKDENNTDHFYALDANGEAKELTQIDDSVTEGRRFEFVGTDDYNSKRIVWDSTSSDTDNDRADGVDANEPIDLWLSNYANGAFYYPDANGNFIMVSAPTDVEHAPGMYPVAGLGPYTTKVANIVAYSVGNDSYRVLKYDEENNKFSYETMTLADIQAKQGTDGADSEYVIYVGLLIDEVSNKNEATQTGSQKVNYLEYNTVTPATENVTMYLFNYGSAINEYGQIANGTKENASADTGTRNGKTNPYNNRDEIFRFFYRPSFFGQALDGSNEHEDEYAVADYFSSRNNLNLLSKTLGTDGYPYYNVGNGITNSGIFSLAYLFQPKAFETASGSMDLYESTDFDGKRIDKITDVDGLDINTNDAGSTDAATTYNPVTNPNYAVQSYKVGNGSTTGLFQQNWEGFYYYDSKVNAAWYNKETNLMELYDYIVIPDGYTNLDGGNFLPFNQGHTQGRLVEDSSGGDPVLGLEKNDRVYQLNGIHNDLDATLGRENMTDLWFGMTLEIEFTMTEDGQIGITNPANGYQLYSTRDDDQTDAATHGIWYWVDEVKKVIYAYNDDAANRTGDQVGNYTANDPTLNNTTLYEVRNDLVFDFSGDDDVLVYVDDVLLLDISGIHGVVHGSINFDTGEIIDGIGDGLTIGKTIKQMFTEAGKADGKSWGTGADGNTSLNTFAPGTTHTLKFFYLERGGNISDCAITFNLEALETGSLSVKKEVEGLDENDNITDAAGNTWSYDGEYVFELVDIVQPYDSTRYDTDGVITSVNYDIIGADGTIVKTGLVLNLTPQTVNTTLEVDAGNGVTNSETHDFEICRYYPNYSSAEDLDPKDTNYYIIYRYEEDGKIYFYSDENENGEADGVYSKTLQEDTAQENDVRFFKVFDSGRIVLQNGQTADFGEFILNTLVKVRELPATNGVSLGTSYWWQISGEGKTSNYSQAALVDDDGMISDYFQISKSTSVDIICRNVLQPVNLGIRKVVNDHDGEQSEDTSTQFSIKYTIEYPNSDFLKVVTENGVTKIYKGNLLATKDDGTPIIEFETIPIRVTNTETWNLTNKKVDYPNPITPAGTIDGQPIVEEYMWTTNIPFGSNITIEEITAGGYDVTWAYEGWGLQKVAIDNNGIIDDAKIQEYNNETQADGTTPKYNLVFDDVLDVIIVINDFTDTDGKQYKVGDVYCEGATTVSNRLAPYHYEGRYACINEVSGVGSTTNQIKLTTEDNYITIYNTPGYKLPETGGTGTQTFTTLGVLFMIAAPLLYIGCRRKRKCEGRVER